MKFTMVASLQQFESFVDGYGVALRGGSDNPLDDIGAHGMIHARCILAWNFSFLRHTWAYMMLSKATGRWFTITWSYRWENILSRRSDDSCVSTARPARGWKSIAGSITFPFVLYSLGWLIGILYVSCRNISCCNTSLSGVRDTMLGISLMLST